MSLATALLGPQARAPRAANNVANLKRQMVAATPGYVAPPVPARPAYPAGGSALLGALTGATEADSAAHLQRQLDPYSPMARHRQDMAQSARIGLLAQGIAGHRQAIDGPWGQGAGKGPGPALASPSPTPQPPSPTASATVPLRIGVQGRPTARIGIRAQAPQARPASMAAAPPRTPTGAPPHAYGPVVPGVDYTPTPIEPTKNTWRPDQGSPSFNWRTHPGMVPLDDATLKAHPYQESRPLRGPNAGYGGPAGGQPANLLDALAGNLQRQASDAAGRNDTDGMARAMGSIDALRNNGAAGLLDFGHRAAMQDSQREQAGARIGVLDRTNPGARIGIYSSPEHARDAVTAKTGDPAMGQQAMQTQRLTEAVAAARGGQPFNLNPNDAMGYLEQYHPAIAPKFRVDEGGRAEGGDLIDLYDYLKAVRPEGWDDPNAMLGKAIGLRVPQIYGQEMPKQTWIPIKPEYDMAKTIPDGGATEWAGSVLHNLLRGNPTIFPGHEYEHRKAASDWFNRVHPQQTPR